MRLLVSLAVVSMVAWAQTYEQRVEAAMAQVDAVAKKGPFHASWDSLIKKNVPEWYGDAKFGIFIHWGVYAVPAFDNEWYPRNMYILDSKVFRHHVETYG